MHRDGNDDILKLYDRRIVQLLTTIHQLYRICLESNVGSFYRGTADRGPVGIGERGSRPTNARSRLVVSGRPYGKDVFLRETCFRASRNARDTFLAFKRRFAIGICAKLGLSEVGKPFLR